MLPAFYKIGNWEWKWLPPDMQKIIKVCEEENKNLKERIKLYQKDEEEYKNRIEELENEIERLHSEAEYYWIKI